MPIIPEIPPDLIDFLIQMEKEEQKKQENRPYLYIPVPNMPEIPPKKEEIEEKDKENGVIIIDI